MSPSRLAAASRAGLAGVGMDAREHTGSHPTLDAERDEGADGRLHVRRGTIDHRVPPSGAVLVPGKPSHPGSRQQLGGCSRRDLSDIPLFNTVLAV